MLSKTPFKDAFLFVIIIIEEEPNHKTRQKNFCYESNEIFHLYTKIIKWINLTHETLPRLRLANKLCFIVSIARILSWYVTALEQEWYRLKICFTPYQTIYQLCTHFRFQSLKLKVCVAVLCISVDVLHG